MIATTAPAPPAAGHDVSVSPAVRRAYAISTGVATLFVFVQFLTSSEFIRSHGAQADRWTAVHGWTALGVLIPALAAALIALRALRRTAPALTVVAVLFSIAAGAQLFTGQMITQRGLDGWIPFHVFFSSAVLALAIWASVRSAALRRQR